MFKDYHSLTSKTHVTIVAEVSLQQNMTHCRKNVTAGKVGVCACVSELS